MCKAQAIPVDLILQMIRNGWIVCGLTLEKMISSSLSKWNAAPLEKFNSKGRQCSVTTSLPYFAGHCGRWRKRVIIPCSTRGMTPKLLWADAYLSGTALLKINTIVRTYRISRRPWECLRAEWPLIFVNYNCSHFRGDSLINLSTIIAKPTLFITKSAPHAYCTIWW